MTAKKEYGKCGLCGNKITDKNKSYLCIDGGSIISPLCFKCDGDLIEWQRNRNLQD
jgi:hypothetical protein